MTNKSASLQKQIDSNPILSQQLQQFTQYLQNQAKSQNTIDSYETIISEYLLFTQSLLLTRDTITSYKQYLLETKQNSASTFNQKLSTLKTYNEFLIESKQSKEGMQIISKDFIKIQKSVMSPYKIDDENIYSLLNIIKLREKYRNYAIMFTLAYTGLRISECLSLKLKDLNFKEHELYVIDGKGNKNRDVLLEDRVIDVLKEYINNHRPNKESDYVFLSYQSSNNYKLCESRINQLFNDYSKVIGAEITPHTLRHFRANDLVNNTGMSLGECAEQLGHENIKTTINYTYGNKKDALNKLNNRKK